MRLFLLIFLLGSFGLLWNSSLKAQSYLCDGGFCDFEVLSGIPDNPDTVVAFSGTSDQDYYIDLRRYVPRNSAGIDREQLTYAINSQQTLVANPTTLFRLNLPASSLLWTNSKAGDGYLLTLEYSQNGIAIGTESLVVRFDTSLPRFNYDKHVDTIFVGTELLGNNALFTSPTNVRGADEIGYRLINYEGFADDGQIISETYSYTDPTQPRVPDGNPNLPYWLEVQANGKVQATAIPIQTGRYWLQVASYRKHTTEGGSLQINTRSDGLGTDAISIVVVDTPIIRYENVKRTVIPASSPSATNTSSPTIDLRGVPYTFSIASVSGQPGRTNAPSSSYTVDPETGVFSNQDPEFGRTPNTYTFTIKATTTRYGGKELERTFIYAMIDTPLVVYPATAATYDYEHDYSGTRDSIVLPSTLDWREDTGTFHLVEVETGYRDADNNFVQQSRTFGSTNVDAALPVDIVYDSDSAKITWNRFTPALEYHFKVIASNYAGVSPKSGEDTARFTLVIRPGPPSINYNAEPSASSDFKTAFNSVVPVIDWKGTALGLRRDSIALISFTGSTSQSTIGTDTEQARIQGLTIATPTLGGNEVTTAGQLSLQNGVDYPANMRAGVYQLRAFVWNELFPGVVGTADYELTINPVAPSGFEYRVNANTNYDSERLWRALSYNQRDKFGSVFDLDISSFINIFQGEVIDSGVTFNSLQSRLYTFLDSDGGDTIRYRISKVSRPDGGATTAFEESFSISDQRGEGSFIWGGVADEVIGNLYSLSDDNITNEDGISYDVEIEVSNGIGKTSYTITMEVYRPTPKLQFTDFPLSTFYHILKPVDGTTRADTTISPNIYPGSRGIDQNAKNWYHAPGRDGGRASYSMELSALPLLGISTAASATNFVLDTTDIDQPILVFPSDILPGSHNAISIQAVNSFGISSITSDFGVLIIDTPRNQRYLADTIRVDCGFTLDSNRLDDGVSLTREAAGYDQQGINYGLEYTILRIDDKLPAVDHDAITISNGFPYADRSSLSGEEIGKVKFNGKKDSRDVFPVDTFDIWIKVTNTLTRGAQSLRARSMAYDSVLMVLVVRTTKPALSYVKTGFEAFNLQGGSSENPTIDWGCSEGTYRLIDTASQGIEGRLSVGVSSGVITWQPELAVGDYTFKVVASNKGGEDTTRHTLRINIAPPSNYIYTPTTLSIPYGGGGESHVPSISWNGSIGNFSITTDNPFISIDATNGRIEWLPDLAVGTYDLLPSASNAGGTATTTFKLQITLSKPSIDYIPNAITLPFGKQGKSELPIINNGGSSVLTYQLLESIAGLAIQENGQIVWSGSTDVGTYALSSVVDNGSLKDTVTYTLTVEKGNVAPNSKLPLLNEKYVLFPNPIPQRGTATLRFGLAEPKVIRISILNLHGETMRVILEKGLVSENYSIPINVGNLPGGIYLLEVSSEDSRHLMRIVITK